MIEFLYNLDVAIFYFINSSIANPVFDKLFVTLTNVNNWYITYIILWGICFFKGGKIGKIAAILAIFLITASDQFSSHLLKPMVERTRPCNVLEEVNILVSCTKSYSWPSSHAVNNFAAAVFFALLFPKLKYVLFSFAFLVALSRPYVGVHYPSDIVAGALIGSGIGYLFAIAARKINERLSMVKESE
jgi:undecaprenyl-diphosphatase